MGRPAWYRRGSITGSVDKYNISPFSALQCSTERDRRTGAWPCREPSAQLVLPHLCKERGGGVSPPSFQLPWHPGRRALMWILVLFVPYLPITSPWHGRPLGSEGGEHSEAGWAASASSRTLSARDCGERRVSVGVCFSSTPEELSRRDTFPADWEVRY